MSDDTKDDGSPDFGEDARADAPLTGRDEVTDRAERRGVGRGVLIGIGAVVVLALVVVGGLYLWGPLKPQQAPPDNTVAVTTLPDFTLRPTETLPGSTPTSAPVDPDATPEAPTTGERQLALSRWNWVGDQQLFSVAGYLPVVESDGTCTLTAVNGDTKLEASEPAVADVTTTTCIVNLMAPDPAPGTWQLTMSYEGAGGRGVSDTVTVQVG